MKRILISLGIIGVVAAVGIGATVAYFNDVETSTGNVFTAGTLDLKVDHVLQTYNDVDCKTCSVMVKSDTSNQVTGTVGGIHPGPFPHSAALVTNINPAWTASIPGASWIWWTDPTPEAEKGIDTIYTFEKTFVWWGPITGATLVLNVGADNSYEVWLNGTKIAGDNNEWNFTLATQDTYSGVQISPWIQQGQNTIEFKVKNWARPQGETWDNPGGLLYKLVIDGDCDNDYFKTNCTLWGEKDLAPGDHFFMFKDVKPGDRGTNIISMHVFGNDGYGCLLVTNPVDNENVCVDPELAVPDTSCGTSPTDGELSQFLSAVVWMDNNPKDNVYNPGETILYGPAALKNIKTMTRLPLTATTTTNIGLAWCLGTQTVDGTGIHCSGTGNQDIAQTDSFLASLTAYAEQQRNNENFNCANVVLPTPTP
jgi:predicted ribosomally synthesized peptide with SipW-like signal peptide